MLLEEKTLWENALEGRGDLKPFGDNAIILFALALGWQVEDVAALGTTSLTDGPNDQKCDLIFIDRENGRALIVQGYMARNAKSSAPINKARDLNTAAVWMLTANIMDLPDYLRPFAVDLRNGLKNGEISALNFWFVHNCLETDDVRNELRALESGVRKQLPDSGSIEVQALEVGRRQLESWYQTLDNPIAVTESLDLDVPGGYEISGTDWKAFVTAVPATWLKEQFVLHGAALFSANVRGYLGSRRSKTNINYGIKTSVKEEPGKFWVYNNGLTVLVNDFDVNNEKTKLTIQGISIVNGAQTTGAVGSVHGGIDNIAMVMVRFVKAYSSDTIKNITSYNNSQNEIEPFDYRSGDHIQQRLRKEFSKIPNAQYFGRRGGAEDIIRRPPDLISADTIAQSLAAFHQDPDVAYNEKANIWRDNSLYDRYFNKQTTAQHIVFSYALLLSVNDFKERIATKRRSSVSLTRNENEQLEVLRQRGANVLFVAAVAGCLETIMDRALPSLFRLSFGNVSPRAAASLWTPIVENGAYFLNSLNPALEKGLKSGDAVKQAINEFARFFGATASQNRLIYEEFERSVKCN